MLELDSVGLRAQPRAAGQCPRTVRHINDVWPRVKEQQHSLGKQERALAACSVREQRAPALRRAWQDTDAPAEAQAVELVEPSQAAMQAQPEAGHAATLGARRHAGVGCADGDGRMLSMPFVHARAPLQPGHVAAQPRQARCTETHQGAARVTQQSCTRSPPDTVTRLRFRTRHAALKSGVGRPGVGLESRRGALLLALLVLAGQASISGGQAPKPKDVIPLDLGPVQMVSGRPGAVQQLDDLSLIYDDYRRIKTRPLLHLEPNGTNTSSPQLFLFSAFFDTRPLYYSRPAVIRMMAIKFEPTDVQTPDVYCKYLVQGQDRYYVSKAHGPLRINTNDAAGWPYRDVIYTCSTTITSVADVEAASKGGQELHLPRFATLVATPDQEVSFDLSWVHVSSIPLVHEKAPEVNRVLHSAREPKGPPFLTPNQYHAGEGDIAVCAGPMYGGDHHAGVIAEWAEFQKIMGVTKVFIFDFSMGRISRHYVNLYQADGFFEVYDLLLSRRLLQPGAQSQPSFCKEKFPQASKRYGQYSDEWVSGCAGSDTHYRVYLRAESALRLHCTYSTMGRYRWVAVIDLDEYLVPRVSPAVGWIELFKQAMADKASKFARYGYQYNKTLDDFNNTYDGSDAPFPSSFFFFNTFVCTMCAGYHHAAPFNTSVDRSQIVTVVPPSPNLNPILRIPRPSMHPVTWAAVRSEVQRPMDRIKSVSDPLATMSHYAHCPWSYWDMEGGTLRIPTSPGFHLSEDVALLYHVRVSHVSGVNALKASHHPEAKRLVFGLEYCHAPGCGSPFKWRYDHMFEDWTIANLFGQQLVDALARKFHEASLHGSTGEPPLGGR